MAKSEYTRHLELDGGINVRDIGGYRARDGRQVKWRKILRSGHLSHMSGDDRKVFADLDLRTVHDFRRSPEIERFPSAMGEVEIVAGYEMGVGSMGMFMQAFEREKFTPAEAHEYVVKAYGECVESVTEPYKDFFQSVLAQEEGAFLFHCMAGKDRTGLAAALLLHILDVPSEDITQDYLLTANYLPIESVIDNFIQSRGDLAELIRENRASLVPYCGVHGDNLLAFFREIDASYGSLDAYIRKGLTLSQGDVEELRNRYLT